MDAIWGGETKLCRLVSMLALGNEPSIGGMQAEGANWTSGVCGVCVWNDEGLCVVSV